MRNKSYSNESGFLNYKKYFIKTIDAITSTLFSLTMLFCSVCYLALSISGFSISASSRYASITAIPLPFTLPIIFLSINKKQEYYTLDTSVALSILRKSREENEKTSNKSLLNSTDKWYRAKYRYFHIVTIVWCSLGIFSTLSRFSNDIKFYVNNDLPNSTIFLTFSGLSTLTTVIALSVYLFYLSVWKKTLIWNFDELNLSENKKACLLQSERDEYIQKKKEKAQNKISNNSSNADKDKNTKKTATNQQYYKTSPEHMTKLAKLKELKELYDNGIINAEEYQKARGDILGK